MARSFAELIAGLCELKNIENDGKLAAGASLHVNGACCSLAYQEQLAPDVVILHVVLDYKLIDNEGGFSHHPVRPWDRRFGSGQPADNVSPFTGRIGQIARLDLAELTPERLLLVLASHAARLAQWRDRELEEHLRR